MHIVGARCSRCSVTLGRLGDGAFTTTAGWQRIQGARLDTASKTMLVRLAPERRSRHRGPDLEHRLGDPLYGVAVISQGKPTDIVNFGRVENTPYLLGAVLATSRSSR